MTSPPRRQVITFTNLFPSELRPQHGSFVYERMHRVLARLGWDWQVICPVAKVPWLLCRDSDRLLRRLPAQAEFEGGSLHHVWYRHLPGVSLKRQAKAMARAARPLLRRLVAGRPSLIDAHYCYPDGVAAAELAQELDLPLVVTARGSDIHTLGSMPPVRRQLQVLRAAAARLAVSADLAGRFAELLGGAEVQVSRNGVDLDFYQPGDRHAARAALGLDPAAPVLLGVGRLVPGKGFLALVRACRELRASVPALAAAKVLLVGEGPQRAELMEAAAPDSLVLLGERSREVVRQAMQAADLLALPSAAEGWPNVITEALACGLPVVANAVGGIPEILAGAPGARLCEAGDEQQLRAALAAVLGGPPDPLQVRAFATRYSWEPSIELLCELFQDLVP